ARSVLFSSHNTKDIEQIADTITFVHDGALLASKDKETFLDDWRRVVCQGSWEPDKTAWPEIATARQNGSILELKVRQFSDDLLQRLQTQGVEIRSTEAMSLEDIFVTTVRAGGAA
ncbi:MAG: ABC transporter ATP-binding protein, partial [Luteimonas sp.]